MSNKSGPTVAAAITALSELHDAPHVEAAVQVSSEESVGGHQPHALEKDAWEGRAGGKAYLVVPPPVVITASDEFKLTVTEHVPLLVTAKID